MGWFEQRVIQNYVSLPFGEHMGFLIGALDGDPSVVTAPALPPRPTTVNTELIKAAVAFLRRTSLSIEPESCKRDLAALTTLALTDAQQRKCVAALDGDVYEDLPKARMALVLRFESLVCAPGVQFQDTVSLEHGLPQTPPEGSDWIKWFPDEDERDGWTHRLANLVPLERNKNASASNDDCAKKKDAYFRGKGKASPFVLPQGSQIRKSVDAHASSRVPATPCGRPSSKTIGISPSPQARRQAEKRINAEDSTRPKPDQVDFRLHLEHR
ncbi:hypothetical protein M233_02265 [Xylella fastidiosa subsp. multiplex Griffin-1]|nr:hypothetical protein Xfasm12_2270 [Xylella fastidiosa M12]ERI60803.1 hypothetical protein M233_02265 [Xylella fastidiosa subsp. multiplex Griffin-1]